MAEQSLKDKTVKGTFWSAADTFLAQGVTFVVGIVQGITAFSIFRADGMLCYLIAVGFTVFSICSVAFKLKGKINMFPVLKCIAYVVILVILIAFRGSFI